MNSAECRGRTSGHLTRIINQSLLGGIGVKLHACSNGLVSRMLLMSGSSWLDAKLGRKGQSGAADASTDMFLGHLCPIDEFRVYGYMTSTRLKLLAVLEDMNDIRESELKRVSVVCLTPIVNNRNIGRASCRERVFSPVHGASV